MQYEKKKEKRKSRTQENAIREEFFFFYLLFMWWIECDCVESILCGSRARAVACNVTDPPPPPRRVDFWYYCHVFFLHHTAKHRRIVARVSNFCGAHVTNIINHNLTLIWCAHKSIQNLMARKWGLCIINQSVYGCQESNNLRRIIYRKYYIFLRRQNSEKDWLYFI